MSKDSVVAPCLTWYSWLLTGFYLYSVNLQGNVVPFLQAEFALSYRAGHPAFERERDQMSGIRYQISEERSAAPTSDS